MIQLIGLQAGYTPGETLEFEYRLSKGPAEQLIAIESSVVWYTEGKGSEDLGVHFFQRISGPTISARNWEEPQTILSMLPASPLSYEGKLLKIRWCVRVRAFLADGTELIAQQPFYLGSITKEI